MSHKILEGKKGIIFGALDEQSIAWKTAESVADALDGFLEEALQAQETASRQREADKEKAVQMAAVHWFGEHGNLDAFDRSKVEVQDFNVSVEARAVSEAECTYHEM